MGKPRLREALRCPREKELEPLKAVSTLLCLDVLTLLEDSFRAVVPKLWVHEHDRGTVVVQWQSCRCRHSGVGCQHLCMVCQGPWGIMAGLVTLRNNELGEVHRGIVKLWVTWDYWGSDPSPDLLDQNLYGLGSSS